MSLAEELKQILIELDIDEIANKVQAALDSGMSAQDVLSALTAGMDEVGRLYEAQEYYLTELVLAGETMKEAFVILQPYLKTDAQGDKNKVIALTVKGDNHDIGKNIFGMLLACHGFEVTDLGVDVQPEIFAAKVVEINPDIVGLSGLITASFESMKATVVALRNQTETHKLSIPIMIGGGMIDEQICQYVGADYWVSDAMAGVRLCEALLNNKW